MLRNVADGSLQQAGSPGHCTVVPSSLSMVATSEFGETAEYDTEMFGVIKDMVAYGSAD